MHHEELSAERAPCLHGTHRGIQWCSYILEWLSRAWVEAAISKYEDGEDANNRNDFKQAALMRHNLPDSTTAASEHCML